MGGYPDEVKLKMGGVLYFPTSRPHSYLLGILVVD